MVNFSLFKSVIEFFLKNVSIIIIVRINSKLQKCKN